MGFIKRFRTLFRDESGNALAIGAAALPLLIGGAGFAIDTMQISLARRELQRAADSAAMAGAYAIVANPQSQGPDREEIATIAADRDLDLNNDVAVEDDGKLIENAPTAGEYAGDANAVRVQLSATRALSFFSFFNIGDPAITVEATAAIVNEGEFCLLALEDAEATGISASGNATINIGCGMSTNATGENAITAGGSSSITATPIMAVGEVPTSTNFGNAQLIPYSAVQTDPFGDVANPTIPAGLSCSPFSQQPNDPPASVGPGNVCWSGADIKGTVNVADGTTIYVDGGTLDFGSQAQVTGNNVTFILTSSNADSNPGSIATIEMNGGADLDINAPTTGPYAGIAFYMDRRAPVGRTIRYNGNSGSNINGAIYFPTAYFDYSGNAQTNATCIQLVGRRLHFTGDGTIRNSCPEGGSRRNFQATFVRLVS